MFICFYSAGVDWTRFEHPRRIWIQGTQNIGWASKVWTEGELWPYEKEAKIVETWEEKVPRKARKVQNY